MMKPLIFTLMLGVALGFSGCADPIQQKKKIDSAITENVREGVYATNDSIHSGRFDLAEKYSDQTVRLVAPPQKRIPIQPIKN